MGGAMGQIFAGQTLGTQLLGGKKGIAGAVGALLGKVIDTGMSFIANSGKVDYGALTQSMLMSNGGKISFPSVWGDSQYSKTLSCDFEFISPYGDPLSIFQYVYVPLCTLLTLALPKQMDSNGYLSPFFVRADIPGIMSTDYGIISSIQWTKGGSANLFTKDRLPRAVSVSITIDDLFPFLAMTKRLSFLTANPSYTLFLDSFSGVRALTDSSSVNSPLLNDYYTHLINRLNNDEQTNWNSNASMERLVRSYEQADKKNISQNSKLTDFPWLDIKK
jgi:hypothetical protein